MWECIKGLRNDNTPIVLFGSEPFSSALRISNIKEFKYDWVWDKKKVTGFLNSKKQPLRQHEVVSVFYKSQCLYTPQFHTNKLNRNFKGSIQKPHTENYGKQSEYISNVTPEKSYPRSIIIQTAVVGNSADKVAHPTQKPVALLEYLIKTYTNEGDTVLDFTMGSGSTAIACLNTNRKFIGIELDEKYFDIAKKRINEHKLM